jgi:hypothetical protein
MVAPDEDGTSSDEELYKERNGKCNQKDDDTARKVNNLFVYGGSNKAGLDASGLSMEKQAKIIHDLSKNSSYMTHAENTNHLILKFIHKLV